MKYIGVDLRGKYIRNKFFIFIEIFDYWVVKSIIFDGRVEDEFLRNSYVGGWVIFLYNLKFLVFRNFCCWNSYKCNICFISEVYF